MTLRDDIWDTALELLVERGKFKVSDILDQRGYPESKRQTVLRTLNNLEEFGWLERESEQSPIWRIGWKGRMFLNVSEEKLEQARA